MEVTSVEAIPVSVPYVEPYETNNFEPIEAIEVVLVRIRTDEDVVGVGEASPIAQSLLGESVGTIVPTIENSLRPVIQGRDPRNIVRLHQRMDERVTGNRAAKAAVEMACYDATARSLDVSVATLLGGRCRERIPVVDVIGIKDLESTVAAAKRSVEAGFSMIKVKIGGDPAADVERTQAVMEAVGDAIQIRVDANQAYSIDEAKRVLTRIEAAGDLALVEQPVPRDRIDGLRRLRDTLDAPLLADESVYTPADAVRIVREEAADVLNVKITTKGGLHRAGQIAAIAEGAGLSSLVGVHRETGVGTAASAQFAASRPHLSYPADITSPRMLEESLLTDPISIGDGETRVPEGPGLGVTLDADAVERHRLD